MKTLVKTPCATAALNFFGVQGTTWNERTGKNVWDNTLRRAGFSVRSRMSKLPKGATVGKARAALAAIAATEPHIHAFIVRVDCHVLVVDRTGSTVVDTAPRKRDARKIRGVLAVWK
jgi:hypothetical protein